MGLVADRPVHRHLAPVGQTPRPLHGAGILRRQDNVGSGPGPLERLIYRWFGISPNEEMTWTRYAIAFMMLSVVGIGALTTFSIANDVAKYFAIIPAAFAATYPVLDVLNSMRLATPRSAILSAVIFNALIIIALIPLALRGVRYRPLGADRILRDNILLYGVGGVIIPFAGIKLIDLLLVALGW